MPKLRGVRAKRLGVPQEILPKVQGGVVALMEWWRTLRNLAQLTAFYSKSSAQAAGGSIKRGISSELAGIPAGGISQRRSAHSFIFMKLSRRDFPEKGGVHIHSIHFPNIWWARMNELTFAKGHSSKLRNILSPLTSSFFCDSPLHACSLFCCSLPIYSQKGGWAQKRVWLI